MAWCRPAARSTASSVFALTVDDAWTALTAMAGPDRADSYSRNRPLGKPGAMPSHPTLGVPLAGQRLFFGDKQYEAGYNAALERLAKLGCAIVDVDIEPFYETARLLYDGPWVAERTITARSLLASAPDAIHPVTKEIILSGLRPTAIDAFAAFYKLNACAASPITSSRIRSTLWRCRRRRPPTQSSRCWPIRSSSTAGSALTPISSTCSICAGWRCRRR